MHVARQFDSLHQARLRLVNGADEYMLTEKTVYKIS
jgi:hypothetical protein